MGYISFLGHKPDFSINILKDFLSIIVLVSFVNFSEVTKKLF